MDNEISKASEILRSDGTILYPTDTIWGIGCDATSDNAVLKVYKIKKRDQQKPLICLASSYEMIRDYLEFMPDFDYHELYKESPTTFIFDSPKGISNHITKYSKSVGFRVPDNDFCKKLIAEFGKPIVSTSANIHNTRHPNSYKEIDDCILKGVDYIVNLPNESFGKLPSSIVNINDKGEINKIR